MRKGLWDKAQVKRENEELSSKFEMLVGKNINNNSLVTDVIWTYCGDRFPKCANSKSLCCIPEINVMLGVTYTLIKDTAHQIVSFFAPAFSSYIFPLASNRFQSGGASHLELIFAQINS